jgi:ubiquitin-conjugating enzyme E2 variant
LLLAGIVIVGSAAALHLLSWRVWLFVILSVNANQIHKWSHTSQAKVPFLVRLLQRSHLLQGPKHHGAHHRSGKDTAYCVLTEALNPFLDGIGFWQGLDRLVFITRATPRRKGVSSGHA